MDLASVFVTQSFDWGIGKALDVLWECIAGDCGQRTEDRIPNVQYHTFVCPNCETRHRQFTNACEHTVGCDGRIAAVGVSFGSFKHVRDRRGMAGKILGWRYVDVQAPVTYTCRGFAGQDLIEVNDVYDLKTDRHVLRDVSTFRPGSNSATIDRWLTMPSEKIGGRLFSELFDNHALLAFDTRIENKYRDVLLKDRVLHGL